MLHEDQARVWSSYLTGLISLPFRRQCPCRNTDTNKTKHVKNVFEDLSHVGSYTYGCFVPVFAAHISHYFQKIGIVADLFSKPEEGPDIC